MVTLINPSDRSWTRHTYILAFGTHIAAVTMVWADSLDDALDIAIGWAAIHAPGLLCDDEVNEEYTRLIATGMSEEEAQEEAEIDTTCGGDCGNYIHSWEWTLVAEDPSRAERLAIIQKFGGTELVGA